MKKVLIIIFAVLVSFACSDKFDKGNLGNDGDTGNIGDTVYVQQFPIWTGFNQPQAMIVGREPFIYVADTENDRIVMLNIAGQKMGEASVPKPVAIAQDYKLNLIVCGEYDTLGTTYGAIYKINMYEAGNIIANANIERLAPVNSTDISKPDIKYTGVSAFYDNTFYIARTGPNNTSPVNPDNSIIKFIPETDSTTGNTVYNRERIPNLSYDGTGLVSANQITSLTSFNKKNIDIVVTLGGDNNFKTQWLTYVVTPLSSKYESHLSAFSSNLMEVNKFNNPEGTCVDESDNLFVADAGADSVYRFNAFGDKLQGFGGSDRLPDLPLNNPNDVAFFDKTLYVLDTGNDRILRFILSTDLD